MPVCLNLELILSLGQTSGLAASSFYYIAGFWGNFDRLFERTKIFYIENKKCITLNCLSAKNILLLGFFYVILSENTISYIACSFYFLYVLGWETHIQEIKREINQVREMSKTDGWIQAVNKMD